MNQAAANNLSAVMADTALRFDPDGMGELVASVRAVLDKYRKGLSVNDGLEVLMPTAELDRLCRAMGEEKPLDLAEVRPYEKGGRVPKERMLEGEQILYSLPRYHQNPVNLMLVFKELRGRDANSVFELQDLEKKLAYLSRLGLTEIREGGISGDRFYLYKLTPSGEAALHSVEYCGGHVVLPEEE